jgi:hypothetical protein
MEALTRLVSESLARHGFDRPPDYRRLQWSRWFRCESPHSLLLVPSKPGVFAVAEEIADFSTHVATDASSVPRSEASAPVRTLASDHNFTTPAAQRPTLPPRRMLAVTQFFEDDDMAFVLDRMLSRQNPMSTRLITGRYFVRFVVIEDQTQRRSICNALNQWMSNTAEKATGIGPHFASSLELTPATEYIPQADEAQQNLFDDANADASNVARTCPERESKGPSPASASATDAPVGQTLPSASSQQAPSATANREGHAFSGADENREGQDVSRDDKNQEGHDFTRVDKNREGHDFSRADNTPRNSLALAAEGISGATTLPQHAEKSSITLAAPHLDSGAATNIHCPSPLPSGF